MPVLVSLLRGVNLARARRIGMEDLRRLCESLKLRDVRTYGQSGNVVFRTDETTRLAGRLEAEIERTFGFHSDVVLRTARELRAVVARNPFRERRDVEPSKLLVTFLASEPGAKAGAAVRRIRADPEELYLVRRELYVYFPLGVGRSKLPTTAIERAIGTPGTARNWNTVTKLLEIAECL